MIEIIISENDDNDGRPLKSIVCNEVRNDVCRAVPKFLLIASLKCIIEMFWGTIMLSIY